MTCKINSWGFFQPWFWYISILPFNINRLELLDVFSRVWRYRNWKLLYRLWYTVTFCPSMKRPPSWKHPQLHSMQPLKKDRIFQSDFHYNLYPLNIIHNPFFLLCFPSPQDCHKIFNNQCHNNRMSGDEMSPSLAYRPRWCSLNRSKGVLLVHPHSFSILLFISFSKNEEKQAKKPLETVVWGIWVCICWTKIV